MSTTDEPDAKDERPDEERPPQPGGDAEQPEAKPGRDGVEATSGAGADEGSGEPIAIEVRTDSRDADTIPAPPVAEEFANRGAIAEARERKRLQDEITRLNGLTYQLRAEVNRAGEDRANEKEDLVQQLRKLQTEFSHHRRRIEREREDMVRQCNAELIGNLLPIVDSFERAIGHWQGEAGEDFFKGVELIYRQLQDLLTRYDVRPIKAVGVEFDPNLHEAVMRELSHELPENHVIGVYEPGYFLGDKLLRPARVVVSAPGSGDEQDARGRGPEEDRHSGSSPSNRGLRDRDESSDSGADGSDPEANES